MAFKPSYAEQEALGNNPYFVSNRAMIAAKLLIDIDTIRASLHFGHSPADEGSALARAIIARAFPVSVVEKCFREVGVPALIKPEHGFHAAAAIAVAQTTPGTVSQTATAVAYSRPTGSSAQVHAEQNVTVLVQKSKKKTELEKQIDEINEAKAQYDAAMLALTTRKEQLFSIVPNDETEAEIISLCTQEMTDRLEKTLEKLNATGTAASDHIREYREDKKKKKAKSAKKKWQSVISERTAKKDAEEQKKTEELAEKLKTVKRRGRTTTAAGDSDSE